MAAKNITTISHLIPDARNANKGTARGAKAIDDSLAELGAGRSILVDAKGNVIAGNKTLEAARRAGMNDIEVIKTDGTRLIVVQRTDLDLKKDARAKKLAIADNRASELSLEWDADILEQIAGEVDLASLFSGEEMDTLLGLQVDANDAETEWQEMPDYDNENLNPHRRMIVNFKSDEAAAAFAKLIKQSITDKTRFVWFPAEKNVDQTSKVYKGEA
jgi:hypothetical protein